jgi:hypothetical protein
MDSIARKTLEDLCDCASDDIRLEAAKTLLLGENDIALLDAAHAAGDLERRLAALESKLDPKLSPRLKQYDIPPAQGRP